MKNLYELNLKNTKINNLHSIKDLSKLRKLTISPTITNDYTCITKLKKCKINVES